jgi:multicomponent Na+:H+ antiporter subunit B
MRGIGINYKKTVSCHNYICGVQSRYGDTLAADECTRLGDNRSGSGSRDYNSLVCIDIEENKRWQQMKKILSVALTVAFISILLIALSEGPTFGNASNPANNYVSSRYIDQGISDTGAINIVTGIVLDYRAFDTFGEATVLFAAVISVIIVLNKSKEQV